MDFYTSIAKYYDHIFPLQAPQKAWVTQFLRADADILDIGCATGNLTIELAKKANRVVGIDLDLELLEQATLKKGSKDIIFKHGDMLYLDRYFKPNGFDIITCFGNTLVHLTSKQLIQQFLIGAYDQLKDSGKLLVQIINYDRVLDQNIKALPTIDNEEINFKRDYEYVPSKHLINFRTILSAKKENREIKNSVWLYPLKEEEIRLLVLESGFSKIDFYGSFKGDKLTNNSQPLIFVASK